MLAWVLFFNYPYDERAIFISLTDIHIKDLFLFVFTSFHFCLLLITFANSLDPDLGRLHVGPDLDPSCLTL